MDVDEDEEAVHYGEDEVHEDVMEDDETEHRASSAGLEMNIAAPPNEIREFCLEKFRSSDFIMEPVLMEFLNRYFAANGEAVLAIEALSSSYEGIAQYVNMFAEWLIILGDQPTAVQELIENHLEQILIKNFDPKKADRIFTNEGGTPTWLSELISHKHWRRMIYRLVDSYRDCLFLNFTVKLISDAGFQNEIPTTTTAVNQMEVFTKVFDSAFGRVVLQEENALVDFCSLVTNSECSYLATQLIMHSLIQECPGGMNLVRIMQDVNEGVKSHHQILQTQLMNARGSSYPRAMQAIASMLTKKSLNPADIQILFQAYSSPDAPPVAMLRFKDLIQLLIESLFSLDSKVPLDHKPKYIYLLAYSAAVYETWSPPSKKNHTQNRIEIHRDDLKLTQEALRKILEVITKQSSDITVDLQTVFTLLKFPIISVGLIFWIGRIVKEPSYFKFAGESRNTPVHLIIVDEIASTHPNLHQRILQLLVEFFEAPWSQLDVLIKLELQKMFLDRMIHLVSCGCVLPVLHYVKRAYVNQETDVSVFRHFVVELLDVISPPYSPELMKLLSVLVSETVTGALRHPDGKDPVSQFLQDCKILL